MDYSLAIRNNKSNAKCRVCRSSIHSGSLCVFIKATDDFGQRFQFVAHTDCFLTYMIREVKKIKLAQLKQETDKFTKIEKLLEGKK